MTDRWTKIRSIASVVAIVVAILGGIIAATWAGLVWASSRVGEEDVATKHVTMEKTCQEERASVADTAHEEVQEVEQRVGKQMKENHDEVRSDLKEVRQTVRAILRAVKEE